MFVCSPHSYKRKPSACLSSEKRKKVTNNKIHFAATVLCGLVGSKPLEFYLLPDAALVKFLTIFVQLLWPGSKHVTADDLCELVIAQIHFMWPKQKNICNLAHMRWTCGWFEAAGHKPNQSVSRGQIQSGQTDNHRCVGNVQQMLPCDQDISTLNKLLINLCQTFRTAVCINLVCYTVSLWVTAIPIKMFITTSRWIALNQCKIYHSEMLRWIYHIYLQLDILNIGFC